MPARKTRNRRGYGETVGRERTAERQEPAVVTPEDLHNANSLTKWLAPYVKYIYDNGGINGVRMPRRITTPILWRKHLEDLGDGLIIGKSYGRDIPPGSGMVPYDEIMRQKANSFQFVLEVPVGNVGDCEVTSLYFDADANVIDGAYNFFGRTGGVRRVAPNASFRSIQAAHDATVTGRIAYGLGRFRDLVIDPQSGLKMTEVWNRDLSFVPPAELIPVELL